MNRREFGLLAAGMSLSMTLPTRQSFAEGITDFTASSNETVYFRGWQFATDVVQSNVKTYNDRAAGKVDYATITGDYPTLMEQSLIANAPLDMFYANPSTAVRFLEGGWLMPADVLPDIESIKADFLPNVLSAWTYKGKLLGLSYFVTCKGCVMVNLKAYEKAGYTDATFPKSWDELYDQVYELHEKGIASPYLPHWHSEWYGISWGFVWEVLNRGEQIADAETYKPLLTTAETGAAYKTLAAWKTLWNSKIVPEEILTYSEAAYISAFSSGRYIFSPQELYDIATFNTPAKSQIAGHCTILPVNGQSWGLIDSALYVMSNRTRSEALTNDVKKFASWYGYKDDKGEVAVGKRWLKENLLFSAYRSVMEAPETAEYIKKAVARPDDYSVVLDLYKAAEYPDGVWKVVWSEEFNTYLRGALQSFLTDNAEIVATIEAINAKIAELNEKYGL